MYDVTAMGELLIDFTPQGSNDRGMSLFARNPGGAPANMLAMLSKLGGRAALISKVGNDEFGRFLTRTIMEAGIESSGIVLDKDYPTTIAFVQINDQGERSFSFYRKPAADLLLTTAEVNRDLIDGSHIFHFGAVSLTGEPSRRTTHEAISYAAGKGKIISYDPNYRSLLWNSLTEAKVEMLRPLSYADILKVSREEMELLTGQTDLEQGAAMLAKKGPAIVLITLGKEGAYYRCADGEDLVKGYDTQAVDSTGAGDAFFGAVLYRLREKSRQELKGIPQGELAEIVDFANAAGALTVTRPGAIPALPGGDEIESLRKNR